MEWSRKVFVGLVIILNGLQGVHLLYPCALTDIYVTEGTENGTVILSFNYSDSTTVTISDLNGFLRIENKSLVVDKTIIVDGNPALCPAGISYLASVTCHEVGIPSNTVEATVHIQLVQNHDPTLTPSNYTFSVKEEQTGTIHDFFQSLATNDCVPNLFWKMGLYENTTKFAFSGTTLLTKEKLDYEDGDKNFTFQIWAKIDETNYTRVANATLHIVVEDLDDMDPTFNRSSYTIAVQENDTSITNQWQPATPPIDAYDRDTGLLNPDPLIFGLQGTPDFLTINATTGMLMFTRVLDREQRDLYNFTLVVRQTRATYRTATATLTVVVNDVNDNRPQFKVADVAATIPEHLADNIAVTQVTATDADQGVNAEFMYFLVNGTDYFAIDPATGLLTVANATAVDREAVSDIVVVVGTTERQPPFLNDTCEGPHCTCIVRVHLTDVNDNSPLFDKSSYEFHMSSGTAGTPVGMVTASDRDQGDNAVLRYRIEQTTSYLAVNSSTGQLTLGTNLPDPGNYDASLSACDSPLPPQQPRCASVLVRVVFGANFTIDTSPINATVRENLPPNTYVTSLKGSMTYEIHNGNFSIQDNALVTKVVLDRETTPSFHLRVDVMINNQVNHSFDVFITVKDDNDNAPQFSPPSYTVFLPEGAQKDVVIGTVTATDPDEGANGVVHYKIQGSMGNSHFRINSSSGEITLLQIPELSPGELYREVLVAAVDGGVPLLMSTASVKVFIGNDNFTVKIPTPVEKETILKDKGYLESELTRILNVSVTVVNVTSVASAFDTKSLMHIGARYANQTPVGAEVLNTLVYNNWDAVKGLFERYRSTEAPAVSSGGMSPHVIALIVIAVVTFIVATTTIAVICRKYEKLQKQNQLYSHLSRDISIYAGHTTMQMEDEASQVSKAGSLSRPLVDTDRHSQQNGHVVGFVNRGFQHEDGDTDLKTPSNGELPNGHVTTVQAEIQESPRELPDDSGNVTPHSGSLTSDPDSGEQDLGQDDLDPIARDLSPSMQANNVFDSEPAGEEVASLEPGSAASLAPDYAARWDEEGNQGSDGAQGGEEGAQSPSLPPVGVSPSIGGRMRTVSVEDLPPPPPPLHNDLSDDDDDDDDDDDVEAANSKFAFRPPTPPMLPPPPAFASGEPEAGSEPPEEPDPDYKHVRFSDAVVAHGDDVSTADDVTSVADDVIPSKRGRRSPPLPSLSVDSDDDDDDDVGSGGGSGGSTEVTQAVVEINSPSDALIASDDDVMMFNFSLDDETTQF